MTILASSGNSKSIKIKSFGISIEKPRSWAARKFLDTIHISRAYSWSRNQAFDIVHNHVWEEGIALSFLFGFPSLTTLHGVAHKRLLPYIITRVCSLTRRTSLVAVSKTAYYQHKGFYGDDLIGYVHNGIDLRKFPFVHKPQKEHDMELSFLGRFSRDKGAHVAIKVAEILKRSGYDVQLKLLGHVDAPPSRYAGKILQMATDRSYLQAFPNIPSDQIPIHIGNSDALLFPIEWEEPFGLVMIEAMACGTPVVAFPKGSVIEIVQKGVNGIICNGVNEMVANLHAIHSINRNQCRRSVEKRFDIKYMYRSYLKLYEEMLARSRA